MIKSDSTWMMNNYLNSLIKIYQIQYFYKLLNFLKPKLLQNLNV